jgi:hypothetical protein
MLIAHGPTALLVNSFLLRKEIKEFNTLEKVIFFSISFLLGILPDFDIFYLASMGRPAFEHHSLLTHTPSFWISLGLVILLICYIFKLSKKNTKIFIFVFLGAMISHILTDAIAGNIMFFFPFYNQYYTLIGNALPDNIFGGYLKSPVFALELIILAFSINYLVFSYLKVKLNWLVYGTMAYLLFSSFMYSQTYQIDLYKKLNGNPIIDTDLDGLADTYDYDFDNNFVNNFDQVSKSDLLNEFEKVSNSTSFVPSKRRSVTDELLYIYGKHTILRGILQAYAQTGNYLPPVIHEYMHRNNIEKFSDGIIAFLLDSKRIKEILQPVPGSLAMAKYGETFTIGIVLRNGDIFIENENGYPITLNIEQAKRMGIRFLD